MAKRSLTRRQSWRAKKVQDERIQRAQKKLTSIDEDNLSAPEQALVIANYGVHILVETQAKQLLKCFCRQNIGDIICGDHVVVQAQSDDSGVVTAILPKKSLLARPIVQGPAKPVAANVDQIVIVSAAHPKLDLLLIDRYLVTIELANITPMIMITKLDLLSDEKKHTVEKSLSLYSTLGYQLFYYSPNLKQGIEQLQTLLDNKVSILVGQSGVGKSSTIKSLLPDQNIKINEVSLRTGLGKHTTSASQYYHLSHGGAIIDSPGVRDFGLWHIPDNKIAWGFREFRALMGRCKFSNCRHEQEPQCAFQAAVKQGQASQTRLNHLRWLSQGYQVKKY